MPSELPPGLPPDRGERRRASRLTPGEGDALSRVRLRAGRELSVVDISAVGVLLDGATRLLPGTHVEVHVTTGRGRTLVRGAVVRCFVYEVSAATIRYRGALRFDGLLDLAAASPPKGTLFP